MLVFHGLSEISVSYQNVVRTFWRSLIFASMILLMINWALKENQDVKIEDIGPLWTLNQNWNIYIGTLKLFRQTRPVYGFVIWILINSSTIYIGMYHLKIIKFKWIILIVIEKSVKSFEFSVRWNDWISE